MILYFGQDECNSVVENIVVFFGRFLIFLFNSINTLYNTDNNNDNTGLFYFRPTVLIL